MPYDKYLIDALKDRADLVRRISVALILAVSLFASAVGQETPKAVLFDEFGKITCEDILARQDALFVQLQNEPTSSGYAIIYVDENNRKEGRRIESVLNGQTEFRSLNDLRFEVKRAQSSDETRVEFWIVPVGASVPEFTETTWEFEVDPKERPFKINTSEWDLGPCPIGSQFQFFSDYLETNDHARGHIVIWAKTRALFNKEKERIDRDFITRYNIAPSRIRYFYFQHSSEFPKWEYWIVPGRIR